MKLVQHRSSNSSCTSSMLRRFRRLRVTAIVYACGSLCGILLFINFNEDFKRLILQKPHYVSGPHEHDHDQEHPTSAESTLVIADTSLRTDIGSESDDIGKVYSDENSHQSKARQKLNSVAAGTLIQSPKDSFSRAWFMWRGTRFPTVETSSGKLWSDENPNSDRITEQLMYITEEDVNQDPSPSLYPGFNSGGFFGPGGGDAGEDYGAMERSSNLRARYPSSGGRLSAEGSTKTVNATANKSALKKSTKIKTILLYYGLGMSWGSHIISGRHVFMQQKCPVNSCRLSGNRSQMSEADVVVFKDVFMNPKVRRVPEQLWVMYLLEVSWGSFPFFISPLLSLPSNFVVFL